MRITSLRAEVLLAAFRIAMLGWSVVIILDSYPNNAFFYTIWNFIMLLVYFLLASCHSVWGLLLKREAPSQPAGLLQKAQLLLFEIELPVRAPAHLGGLCVRVHSD